MNLKRRDFINLSAFTFASGIIPQKNSGTSKRNKELKQPLLNDFSNMTIDISPITDEERKARIEKAQRLLTAQNIQALLLDAGTTMEYFTGVNWWPSGLWWL